jgi:hypothetical protein
MSLTPSEVDNLMQQAGWAWMRMRVAGFGMGMQVMSWEVLEDSRTAYGYTDEVPRRSTVSVREIYLMDEASRWLGFIEDSVVRRVVAMRMLYDDDRGRCVHSYRRIGQEVRTSSERVRGMHWRGLGIIAREISKNKQLESKITLYLPERTGVNSVTMDFGGQSVD